MKLHDIYPKQFLVRPTAYIFLYSVLASVAIVYLYHNWVVTLTLYPWLVWTFVLTMASAAVGYAQFTVVHEAIHNNISTSRLINNLFGYFASMWLGPLGYWWGVKYIHLEHHKYTNVDGKDPDMWAALNGWGGPWFVLARWITVDIHYIKIYIEYYLNQNTMWTKIWITLRHIIVYSTHSYIVYRLYIAGFGTELLLFWVVASRFSLAALVLGLDFLPHYPHEITRIDSLYKTTAYVSVSDLFRPLFTFITMYHNYHPIHHINTTIPFYLYQQCFRDNQEILLKKYGIPVTYLITWPQKEKLD